MRILLGVLLALLSVQTAHGMTCSSTVNGVKYDLSDLTGTVSHVIPSIGAYDYYINPCGAVTQASCTKNGGSPFVCQVRKSPTDQFESVVAYSDDNHAPPPVWSQLPPSSSTGVVLTFSNGDTCNLKPRYAIITFICSENGGEITVSESPQCTFNINYPTRVVCPGYTPGGGGGGGGGSGSSSEEDKGLSGGWIFIIILLVGGFVAFVSGMLYKRQKLGAQGIESVPLIDFWRELPGLIKDGCRFTYIKISSLFGGKTGNTESYETIK